MHFASNGDVLVLEVVATDYSLCSLHGSIHDTYTLVFASSLTAMHCDTSRVILPWSKKGTKIGELEEYEDSKDERERE